jgi:hypothetical protein
MAGKLGYACQDVRDFTMTNSRFVVCAVLSVALLPGCARIAESRLNPANWFTSRAAEIEKFSVARPADPRPLIDMIVDAALEPLPSGAVLRAKGRAARQGYWMADLVVTGLDKDGNLVVDFRAIPTTAGPGPESPPRTREITAAVSLRADTLASAKRIILRSAENEKSLRP